MIRLKSLLKETSLNEQSPKEGDTVTVDSPSNGYGPAPVPTDSKTLGEASRIIGMLLKAFQGRGTDDTAARKAIYSIDSKELYYAVLWKLQHSTTVKSIMGYNYNSVGDFLSTDMTYTQHGMPLQTVFGLSNKQYVDYERHLKQFNKDEEIKRDKRFIGWK